MMFLKTVEVKTNEGIFKERSKQLELSKCTIQITALVNIFS